MGPDAARRSVPLHQPSGLDLNVGDPSPMRAGSVLFYGSLPYSKVSEGGYHFTCVIEGHGAFHNLGYSALR